MTNFLEVFDVVDANDQIIGCSTRGDVHARDLWHRAVHVLIFNAQGDFYLQKRSVNKDRFPGCWDSSCSGHVDSGEDYATAAHRELAEELGLSVGSVGLELHPLVKLSPSAHSGFEFIQVYLLGPYAGEFRLDPEEISDGKYLSRAALSAALAEQPDHFAGALQLLWKSHRAHILAKADDLLRR